MILGGFGIFIILICISIDLSNVYKVLKEIEKELKSKK